VRTVGLAWFPVDKPNTDGPAACDSRDKDFSRGDRLKS
jgi:hypothetical protein